MPEGLLDTNLFIHAHTSDAHAEECRRFLAALESGKAKALLTPVILHELSYALPYYLRQMTRADVADYLLMVLSWTGVVGDKGVMTDTVERWRGTARLSFADAYLAALAADRNCAVFTKNVSELVQQGADVPRPLPG